MVSGEEIYSKLQGKISEVDRKHDKLSNKVTEIEDEISSLTSHREKYYSNLAEFYLPGMNAQSIQNTLKDVQGDVQRIFQKKKNRRVELEGLIEKSKEQKKDLEENLSVVSLNLNNKGKERDNLKEQVVSYLNSYQIYSEMSLKASQMKGLVEQNKERVEEAKQESKEKLKAFNQNNLFMYLENRMFGTNSYSKGGLTKALDSWLAKFIDYKSQKQNFDFLRAMPDLMEIEVNERQKDLDGIVDQLKVMEKDAEDKYGLTKVIKEGNIFYNQRKELLSKIEGVELRLDNYSVERSESDSEKGKYYEEAIGKLKSYLKGEDISNLKEKARNTPDTRDENLVEKIEEIDISIRNLKDTSKETKKERDELREKLKGLNNIKRKFSSNDYESHRSEFDSDFNISVLIAAYLIGKYSESQVWKNIETNQDFRPAHTSSYHSSSYDSGSSHNSGSSFGGGSFSSGGGFGGGGFSSGSGF